MSMIGVFVFSKITAKDAEHYAYMDVVVGMASAPASEDGFCTCNSAVIAYHI